MIRRRVKNFIQLAAKILMKGGVGYGVHLFNSLNFIVYWKKIFNVWICYIYSLLYLLLEKLSRIFFLDSLLDWSTVHAVLPLLEAADFNGGKGKEGTERTSPLSQSPRWRLGIPVWLPRSRVTVGWW